MLSPLIRVNTVNFRGEHNQMHYLEYKLDETFLGFIKYVTTFFVLSNSSLVPPLPSSI